MNYQPESRPAPELDDDERYYATAPVDEIRRELERYGVRVKPAIDAVRTLVDERTTPVPAASAHRVSAHYVSAHRVSALHPEPAYLEHLTLIERIAAFVARRGRLTADETDEFVQIVYVKLLENDYAIIRKFEGRSSFPTYLTTVIARLFHQRRLEQWGKWRPSAQARTLGETAITLERLMSRDGFSFSEAVATLTCGLQRCSVEELEAIYPRLPLRKPRPVLLSDENVLAELPAEDSAEERVRAGERETASRAAITVLNRTIGDFSPEDRLLLQLRFWDRRTVPEIARITGLEQKKLYKRLDGLFQELRRALEKAGIDRAAIGELLDQPTLDLPSEPRPERTSTPRSTGDRKPSGSNGERR